MSKKSVSRRTLALPAAALGLLLPFGVTAPPAAAAMTEIYYQQTYALTCAGDECGITLPKIAADTQLNIRQVSCAIVSTAGSVLFGMVEYHYTGNDPVKQYMAPTKAGQVGLFFQEMDILVPAQKVIGVSLFADAPTMSAYCTLTGRLQKFS